MQYTHEKCSDWCLCGFPKLAPGASAPLPLPTPHPQQRATATPPPAAFPARQEGCRVPKVASSFAVGLLASSKPVASPCLPPEPHCPLTGMVCAGAPPSSRLIHVSGLPLRAPWATQYEEAAQKRTQRNLSSDTGHMPLGHLLNPSPFTTKQKRQTGNARLLKITLLLSNRTTVSKMSL